MNIYTNDNIDLVCNEFIHTIVDIVEANNLIHLRNAIISLTTKARNGFAILENRHLTSVGMRIFYTQEINGITKQLLLRVWRSQR